jgi:hypothetical protein
MAPNPPPPDAIQPNVGPEKSTLRKACKRLRSSCPTIKLAAHESLIVPQVDYFSSPAHGRKKRKEFNTEHTEKSRGVHIALRVKK